MNQISRNRYWKHLKVLASTTKTRLRSCRKVLQLESLESRKMFEASPWGSAMNDEISDVNSAWLMDLQQATKPEESRLDSGQSAAGCDINSDGICDANDIDAMSLSVMDGAHSSQDRIALIEGSAPNGFHTYVGDSNLNGVFDEQDLVSAFIEGKYLTGERAGWAQGLRSASHYPTCSCGSTGGVAQTATTPGRPS